MVLYVINMGIFFQFILFSHKIHEIKARFQGELSGKKFSHCVFFLFSGLKKVIKVFFHSFRVISVLVATALRPQCDNLWKNLFVSIGLAYGMSGVGNIVVTKNPVRPFIERISYFITGLSSILIAIFGMKMLDIFDSPKILHRIIVWGIMCLLSVVAIYAAVAWSMSAVGVTSIFAFITITAILFKSKSDKNKPRFLKPFGSFCMAMGLIIQGLLAPSRVDRGYEGCFTVRTRSKGSFLTKSKYMSWQ